MKIAVTTPVYLKNHLHYQYLHWTVKSISSKEHQIVFIPIENYIDSKFSDLHYPIKESIELVRVKGREPQSVTKGWNDGIKKGIELGCEYVLVINDDIIIKSNAIDRLVSFAESKKDNNSVMWTMGQWALDPEQNKGVTEDDYVGIVNGLEHSGEDENSTQHPNFSAYMVGKTFIEQFGEFDENFYPAYFEDNDMHARICLVNKKAVNYGGARFFHYGSRTVNSDMEYREKMPPMFRANAEYFKTKWGITPVHEPDEMREKYWKHPYNEEDKVLSYWRK